MTSIRLAGTGIFACGLTIQDAEAGQSSESGN